MNKNISPKEAAAQAAFARYKKKENKQRVILSKMKTYSYKSKKERNKIKVIQKPVVSYNVGKKSRKNRDLTLAGRAALERAKNRRN